MVKFLNETVCLPLLSCSIEVLKTHPNFQDFKIKYRSNGSIVERQFNKTILALHSEYFLNAIVSLPIDELDLTKVAFDGKVLEIVFDSVFVKMANYDFNLWLKDGILCQVYEAADYFLHQPLMNALEDYMENDVISVLMREYESPDAIFEKLCENNLFTILDDDCFQDSASSKSMYKFLQENLIAHLEKQGSEIKVPVKVIGKVLKLNPNVHDKDESSVFDLFIILYEGLCNSDQAILKPFMLNYFDYRKLSDEQIGRLVKDVKDMKVFLTRFHPDGKCPALPLSFSKVFTYKADDDSFAVEIPIKYGIYDMTAELTVSQTNSAYLQCYLHFDATVMTDRIPEFTVSIFEIENVSVIRSLSIVKDDTYVSGAMDAIRGRVKSSGRGWSRFLERSDLIDGKQYQFNIIFKRFVLLPDS